MQQLDLLTIRKQPLQPEPKIPSRTIKAYVKQNLRDFNRRQAERERLRAEKDARRTPRTKRPKQENPSHMRIIKVTYRALFQQPQGVLNPMGLKLPGPFPVELFQTGANWQAQEIASPARHVYKLGKFASLQDAKRTVAEYFESQLEDWQMWSTPPHEGPLHPPPVERLILPDEIAQLPNGKIGWKQAEDYTHIIHAPTIPPGARIPPAACGVKVKAECFINTHANVEPSCKACAEVWRKEYQNR